MRGRFGPLDPRGPLPPHQEGRLGQEALGEEQDRQGLQVVRRSLALSSPPFVEPLLTLALLCPVVAD